MLLYQLCRIFLEFLSSLDSTILGGLIIILLAIGIFVDGDLAKCIFFLVIGAPFMIQLVGMFANYLLDKGAWMVAGIILYGIMDIGIIAGFVWLGVWLINEIR